MSTDYKQQHISNDFYLSMAIRQTDITFSNRTKKNIVSIIIGLKRNRIIKSISTIRHVLGWLDMNSEHKTPYYIPPNIHQSHNAMHEGIAARTVLLAENENFSKMQLQRYTTPLFQCIRCILWMCKKCMAFIE